MRSFYIAVFTLFLSCVATADSSFELSESLVQKFRDARIDVETISKKYPELDEKDVELELLLDDNGQGLIDLLRTSGAYNELNTVTKKYGFNSVEQYVELMSRLMAGLVAIEFAKQSPEEIARIENFDEEKTRKELIENGASPELIDMQLNMVKQMTDMARKMRAAAAKSSKEDQAFVEAHHTLVASAVQ